MRAAPLRRLFLPALALLVLAAVAGLLRLPPADQAQAQAQDGERPRIIAGPTITSSPDGDAYGAGESITVAITYNETVIVTGSPRLRMVVGEGKRWAHYQSGSDSAILTFAYTVKAEDRDDDGIRFGKNALNRNGGAIEDADGNRARMKHSPVADDPSHRVKGSPESPNSSPAFTTDSVTLTVNEDAAVGANVGAPVTATDPDGDPLTYTFTGSDAFAIGQYTGANYSPERSGL